MLDCSQQHDIGGEPIDESLLNQSVLGLLRACQANSSCEIIELRQNDAGKMQSIVVDFADGTFDSLNAVGINRVERLALSYCEDANFPWEVRAMRKDFPYTAHQNHAPEGEPKALCLYLASWESVQRSWTPQLFVSRILWWLRATAEESIHSNEQPIEQLFFVSPFTFVLPKGHFERDPSQPTPSLVFTNIFHEVSGTHTLIGKYRDSNDTDKTWCYSFSLLLDPVEYGPIEGYASNLGQLSDVLSSRNCDLVAPLKSAIQGQITSDGIEPNENESTLLILGIPRLLNGEKCGIEVQGFIAEVDRCELGEKLALLQRIPGDTKYYEDFYSQDTTERWREILLDPVNIRSYPNEETVRRYSGIPPDDEGPKGIIAGVGALGGLLAKIWNTECWGDWSYVDSDIIQAHNIVRHIATHHCVGHAKAQVVSSIVHNIHPGATDPSSRVFDVNIESENHAVKELVKNASLLVDVTTTIHVPRMIARSDEYPRAVNVFLTPSGMSAVLLMEDEQRKIRCNSLEAQYYRAVLDSEWGERHLGGHLGKFWVGGGCREVTLSLSNEILHLHAGNLARQIRNHFASADAKICIWEYQEDEGSVLSHDTPVYSSRTVPIGDWEVVLDECLLRDAENLRANALPAETGGVLLGIVDQKDRTITLVKVCESPANSDGSEVEFTRAGYESSDFIQNCLERTAGIVTYVGEWHSHPKGVPPLPSESDFNQYAFVHDSLAQEGQPAVMMIVSENVLGLYLCGMGAVISTNQDE